MPSGLVRAIQTKASITTSTGETDAGSEVGAGGARKRLKLVAAFGGCDDRLPRRRLKEAPGARNAYAKRNSG